MANKWEEAQRKAADLYNQGRTNEQEYISALNNIQAQQAQYTEELKKSTANLKRICSI